MDYESQLAQWEEALRCAEYNMSIGQALKVKGMATLNFIEIDQNTRKLKEIEAKDLAALMHSATQAIKEGVKLEADSRQQRGDLQAKRPLKKSWE